MGNVALTNIVKKKALREVQCSTLQTLSDAVSMTAGPCGCNSMILHDVQDSVPNEYTKDGHKTLKNIRLYDPLEESIQREILEATTYLVKTVGDGTTSLVKIISNIFNRLVEYEESNENVSTFEIVKAFKDTANLIRTRIIENGRELTVDDIYKICMISTDGDELVSANIRDIYEKYGLDVYIHLGISNTTDHILKSYDGLTLERGFTSPSFINNSDGQCVINNPRLYCFEDPIDTPEMISLFTNIVINNIIEPTTKGDIEHIIPTVLMAPNISRDASKFIEEVESFMYRYPVSPDKPPLLVITGLNLDIDFYSDLTSLCGCKTIKKYIDPEVQKKDVEDGLAPTPETVTEWYGEADQIISDNERTTFINPKLLFTTNEKGEKVYSEVYKGTIEFLTSELEYSINNSEDLGVIGNLKRRLNSLKSNYVEYLIGGITVADRDSVKDLAEDAILNCRSAANYGVGYGANFEGFLATSDIYTLIEDSAKYDDNMKYICNIILWAFRDSIYDLYRTVYFNKDEAMTELNKSIDRGEPINLRTKEYNNDVLCSINTDATIIETISKLIMVMFNTNQALLVSPLNNKYIRKEDI